MSTIEKARDFAREKHKNQVRKWSNLPYYSHLEEVAAYVALTRDETAIAVAYLHDTLEDTATSQQELFELFGMEITDAVISLTDILTPEDGNRKFRKKHQLERLVAGSKLVQSVKLADLISNGISIAMHDEKFAKTFFKEMSDLLLVMKKGDPILYEITFCVCARGINLTKELPCLSNS